MSPTVLDGTPGSTEPTQKADSEVLSHTEDTATTTEKADGTSIGAKAEDIEIQSSTEPTIG